MGKYQLTAKTQNPYGYFSALRKKLFLTFLIGGSSVFIAASVIADPLKTYTLEPSTMPRELAVEGKVEAINIATVTSETSGTIVEINFDINDFVKNGQVLLRFSGTSNRAAYNQAKANVASAQARLTQAESEHKRIATLLKSKTVSASQMDKTDAALKSAKAQLKVAEAQLADAQKQLNDTVVRAPYDGYVRERHIELGEVANPGTPLFTGMSLEQLRVLAAVPQTFVEAIKKHQKAFISIRGEAQHLERKIPVNNIVIFPFAKKGSYNIDVRLELEKGTAGIFPGMLVKAVFLIGERQRYLIPKSAIIQRSEVTGVYVVYPDDQVRLRLVRTGSVFDNQYIEVLAGLDKGEKIAVNPVLAGQKIKEN